VALRKSIYNLLRDVPPILGALPQGLEYAQGGLRPSVQALARQGTSPQVGDFIGLKNASVEDIIARIPRGWNWQPQSHGAGVRFFDTLGRERIRIHDINPTAPWPSNSSAGWTLRIHVPDAPNAYLDEFGRVVAPAANAGHIPIAGNPNGFR
jgi:hypothetical protein